MRGHKAQKRGCSSAPHLPANKSCWPMIIESILVWAQPRSDVDAMLHSLILPPSSHPPLSPLSPSAFISPAPSPLPIFHSHSPPQPHPSLLPISFSFGNQHELRFREHRASWTTVHFGHKANVIFKPLGTRGFHRCQAVLKQSCRRKNNILLP